jgi:hypothetical protein
MTDKRIREFAKLLAQVEDKENFKLLLKNFYSILKEKFEKKAKKTEDVVENEDIEETKEDVEEKLHAIRKFKIDEETLDKMFKESNGNVTAFFSSIAKILPNYFKDNQEMLKYIKNKCYVSIRVKTEFKKEADQVDTQIDEEFIPHQHRRKNLVQSLEDLSRIFKELIPSIEERISEFIRNGSGYIVSGIKSISFELTPFKPGIRKARGYIPLYPWLRGRRAVINIQNKDNLCFWKCFYRAFVKNDKWGHSCRDAPMNKLEEFMKQRGFDVNIFKEGYTIPSLAIFEEKYKISINIYEIGMNGPHETKQYYFSIYDSNSVTEKVDLGVLRNDKGDTHFVVIKKLASIFSEAYNSNHGHEKMCQGCGLVFKSTERLLEHYKEDHKDENMKKQVINLPEKDVAWVEFDMNNKQDFSKTLRHFFVCYADFECSNIPIDDPSGKILTRQIPNSFMIFCPNLLNLNNGTKFQRESYLKYYQDDDPYKVLEQFIQALEKIRKICVFHWQSHPNIPKLTKEEQIFHDSATNCEKCKKPFDKERPKVRHHCHVTGKYIGPWCRRCNYL